MANNNDLEKRLWQAADQLWANSSLRPSEYSGPVLGLIFFPPLGIIIGPFAGAVIGEALTGKDAARSFRAGLGSLLGLMMGIGLKLAASIAMTYYFVKELIV